MRGDVVSYNWKTGAMVEYTIVKKDENQEDNTARVEASKNGARLAPALDLRSSYLWIASFPRFKHALTQHNTVSSMSISPPLRAAARSVYRNLWRASATTFSGTVGSFLNNVVTYLYFLEGDPPVLLGMARGMSPSRPNAFVKHSDKRLEKMH